MSITQINFMIPSFKKKKAFEAESAEERSASLPAEGENQREVGKNEGKNVDQNHKHQWDYFHFPLSPPKFIT